MKKFFLFLSIISFSSASSQLPKTFVRANKAEFDSIKFVGETKGSWPSIGSGTGVTWTAEALGIEKNGVTDQSAVIQKLLDATELGTNTIWFESKEHSTYLINDTIIIPAGKVLKFEAGNRFTGTGVILGPGSIEASPLHQICDVTMSLLCNFRNGKISVKWYGAIGIGNSTDDGPAMQKAINDAINGGYAGEVYWPIGIYTFNKGLLAFPRTGQYYLQMNFVGEGNAYDPNLGGGVKLICKDKLNFGLGLQKAVGSSVRNLHIIGENTGINAYTYPIVVNDTTTFVTNGVRNQLTSPYSGIVFDPIGDTTYLPVGSRYPGFTTYTSTPNTNAGGTQNRVENCKVQNFVVGICNSPSSTLQNAEAHLYTNNWVDLCKVAIGNYNPQTILVEANHTICWQATQYVFDGSLYGAQVGILPVVNGVNIAGGIKYLYRSGNSEQSIYFNQVYAELLWSLGGSFNGKAGNVYFNQLEWFKSGNGAAATNIKAATTILNAKTASFHQSWIKHRDGRGVPFMINANLTSFSGICALTDLMGSDLGSPVVKHSMTEFAGSDYPYNSDGTAINVPPQNYTAGTPGIPFLGKIFGYAGQTSTYNGVFGTSGSAGTVANINNTSYTWTYTFSDMSKITNVRAGDALTIVLNKPINNEMNTSISQMPGGYIDSVNYSTGVIRVYGIPYGVSNGTTMSAYTVRQEIYKPIHIGFTKSGSNSITGVFKESYNTTNSINVGQTIYSENLPDGFAYVTAVAGTTVTIDKNATATGRTAINTYHFIKEVTKANPLSGDDGFQKGDKVINSFASDTTVAYWVCTYPGINGSAYPPVFKAIK